MGRDSTRSKALELTHLFDNTALLRHARLVWVLVPRLSRCSYRKAGQVMKRHPARTGDAFLACLFNVLKYTSSRRYY
jgi:hypothetical protein